ncbi:MAG TPA: shikimate dehydrogenase [Dehalococcoidia bacterium]|nr:shikimate dehydrogenase [Dehalococcoidia bacterium]
MSTSTSVETLGIIGFPARHSLSPAFQQAAIDALGLYARYEIWEVAEAGLGPLIASLRSGPRIGANVTIPHKQAVRAFLDRIDALADRIGAVNTIVREGGRLVGYNTDAPGFLRSLVEAGGDDPAGAAVLLLGAGGAARAVAYALIEAGVERLTIANRGRQRAEELAGHLGAGPRVAVVDWASADLIGVARAADLIVNATSLGMAHGPAAESSPLPAGAIRPGVVVYDLVYVPARTPLLAQAAERGARLVEGLPMLIHQGAIAFEHWFGRPAPIGVMTQAAEAALAARRG